MRGRGSIFQNALALTGVNLLLRGVSMLFRLWLSGQIGAGGIGLLQLVLSAGGFAMTLALAGVRTAAMYLCAEEHGAGRLGGVRRAVRLCLGYALLCSVLAAALLFFSADYLAANWLRDARAADALRIFALSLPLNAAVSVLSAYCTACGRLRPLIAAEVTEQLVGLLLSALFLQTGAGADLSRAICAPILGSAFAAIIPAVWLGSLLRRDLRAFAPEGAQGLLTRLLRLSLPLAAGDLLRAALRTLEQFLIPLGLSSAGGSAADAMADYGVICGMVFPFMTLPAAVLYSLSELLVPELARCRARGEYARLRRLCSRCLRLGVLFSSCVAALMYLCAQQFGTYIYKSESVGVYLRLFSPLLPMLYTDALVDGMCKGLGRQVTCVRNNTITSVLDAVLLWLLLPRYGITGYFVCFTVTHAVNFYLSLLLLLDEAKIRPNWRFAVRLALSVLAPAAACSCLPADGLLSVFLRCAVFFLLHVPLARGLCLLSTDERLWLARAARITRHPARRNNCT